MWELSCWSDIQTSIKNITERTLYPRIPDVFIAAIHDQLRQYNGTRL